MGLQAMAKPTSQFVCQSCGAVSRKWEGQCSGCGEWDTVQEEPAGQDFSVIKSTQKGKRIDFEALDGITEDAPRYHTHIDELDRVLGGGLVKGSAVLIGGDPGIGKSTLLLQTLVKLSESSIPCAYISGEESIGQIRARAKRLGLEKAPLQLAAATSVQDIITTLDSKDAAKIVVIDSIQTMFVSSIASAPGTVSQVRAASHELIRLAKQKGIVMLLVGHVTKEGQIAGPKVLEHMVDTVLYFEGERGHQFRILRAVKNRFGGVNEIGVFEMTSDGLAEVPNPSALFLTEREGEVSGACVFAGLEGTRPVLVEVQALVAPTQMATPRRAVVGWDMNRLAMIIAVLTTRYGIALADKEVYLNVAGGLRISEPAADLAVAMALISSLTRVPLPEKTVIFGEIGLSGEIRQVPQADIRIKEAQKLGFTGAIVPQGLKNDNSDFQLQGIRYIKELVAFFKSGIAEKAAQQPMEMASE